MALKEVRIPEMGNFKDVGIIEVLVKKGDLVAVDQPLITLESDKAAMDVPCPQAGTIREVKVQVGDKVSAGSLILLMEVVEVVVSAPRGSAPTKQAPTSPPPLAKVVSAYAGPAVRQLARQLGVELARVPGSGRKGRILKEDVQAFVKQVMTEGRLPEGGGTTGIPPVPEIDFSQFGEIERRPLSRIKRLAGASVYRSWLNVPQVTQFDEADITELEQFRQDLSKEGKQRNIKVTLLAFLLKAAAAVLKQFPEFNASLEASKENLILKKYYHIGVAVDTPQGLVVPVVKEVNFKGLFELAAELGVLSQKARDGKLAPADLQGATFTISSLGGIGGTGFTPIVNAPEVAILGVARAQIKPLYQGEQWLPRLCLPFAVSYDHRVIDGALAARFTGYWRFILSDVRRLLV